VKRSLGILSFLALASLATLAGCGPGYDRTEISTSVRVLGNDVDETSVKVVQGTVVVAHIVSYDTNKKRMSVRVRSADERLLDVSQAAADGDWAFMGLESGSTTVEILADGESVMRLQALVMEQPPLP
jgi:hypothetical protein